MCIFLISLPGSSNPEEKMIPLLTERETKRGWKGTLEISEKRVGKGGGVRAIAFNLWP